LSLTAKARKKPARLTPEKALAGVRKLSRLNGWSVVIIASLGTFVTLLLGDLLGLAIGLLVMGAGVMEVHGNRRLANGDAKGMNWLVRSQLFLMAFVVVYAVSRLASFDGETALANLTPEMAAALQELQIDPRDLLPLIKLSLWGGYGAVMVVTIGYQGGLSLFYRGRIPLVTQALDNARKQVPMVPMAPVVAQHFYDTVAAEMAANDLNAGLWARALAESGGDENRCKAIYIRARVGQLSGGGGDGG
jgi:hypothetical protein